MPDMIDLARAIANIAHRGQTRMDGIEPYINHPLRVAKAVLHNHPDHSVDNYVLAAAVLHDVIEDSSFEAQDLLDLGLPKETVDLVEALSRRKREGESYWDYIERVAAHSRDAVLVKIADVEDNLASLPPGHGLKARYEKTLARLRRLCVRGHRWG